MYRRIAVALDGTATSQHAIPWALSIARKANCPIELVHVAFPPVLGTELYGESTLHPDDIEAMRRTAQHDLQSLADRIRPNGVATTVTVLTGDIRRALSDHLREGDADLVVMTTHDAGRIERFLVGSVADSVVRHAHMPVLLIHADDVPFELESPRTIQKMLIPLDGSRFGEAILPHARRLASLLRSEITLLGVLEPTPSTGSTGFERIAAALSADGLRVHTSELVDEQPARMIVDYAKNCGMDAIAMTTHGHGALKRMVAGSVSQQVLRTSHLPMLMFRPRIS